MNEPFAVREAKKRFVWIIATTRIRQGVELKESTITRTWASQV